MECTIKRLREENVQLYGNKSVLLWDGDNLWLAHITAERKLKPRVNVRVSAGLQEIMQFINPDSQFNYFLMKTIHNIYIFRT